MTYRFALAVLATAFAAGVGLPAGAELSINMQEKFRIGTTGNAVCTAQSQVNDRGLKDMFDRGYSVVCRDASVPVGRLYVLRMRGGDPASRLAAIRNETASCEPPQSAQIEGLGAVETTLCRLSGLDVGYQVYAVQRGNSLYLAEGLAAYEGALRLGLQSLVANRVLPGEVSIATTGIGDPVSFARVQAGTISPQQARIEAYRSNNSGDYAEAAEFFASFGNDRTSEVTRAEALANEGLQKSNLGSFREADMLFAKAAVLVRQDPVIERQLRNYRVMHLLNQGKLAEAYVELEKPMPEVGTDSNAALRGLSIDADTSNQLSNETPAARRLGATGTLSPQEKAGILDAQALQLRGSALRIEGKPQEATATLQQAREQLAATRGGRVAATLWMQAQILSDLADIAEESGNLAEAEGNHRSAIALIEPVYPASARLMSTKGQLAAFLARTGRTSEALSTFAAIIGNDNDGAVASPSMRPVLGSYFMLLTRPDAPPEAVSEMFHASQLLLRPGVAQTQAILARELSGGSDEAARLFRQSLNLSRDIERDRVEVERLRTSDRDGDADKLSALQASLKQAQSDQIVTQAQLAQFPRYRALSNATISIQDLQALLRPGEAYYKLVVLGGHSFALFVSSQNARAFRVPASAADLDRRVDALRATIATEENGQLVTYPFDVNGAHKLYEILFAPVSAELAQTRHLIFEPDGAMLRLPPNLLVMDQASVDAYAARAARPNDDGFDFRGVAWLGRNRDVSTSVSAPAFRDLRNAAPSRASAQYIGFGQNKPADAYFLPAGGMRGAAGDDGCGWSLAAWNKPISAEELNAARRTLAGHGGGTTAVVTGSDFTDDGIKGRTDLDQYRIVHFATHGMLAPPRPECPARPSLMTSFGGADSDGLLSFGEIFDLRLDADVVILSACDTAGRASGLANQEAGITSGGEFALDGLVRAFVGAGGRLVIASHWPVPDDFGATKRLISGLFAAPAGTGSAAALAAAQLGLMDDINTSHPFYWSGFAVVGDGAAAFIRPGAQQQASLQQ